MKRRKGIDLGRSARGQSTYIGELDDVARDVRGMREWECVGGRCECEREAWLDRWEIQGGRSSIVLSEVAKRLRCRSGGDTVGNRVILGRLPRD